MAKKRIGIKYCGGCNPHYDRVGMVERTESLLKNRFIFLRHDEEGLDGLVLVNGCPRSCSTIDPDRRDLPSFSVSGEADFENLQHSLMALDEKGKGSQEFPTSNKRKAFKRRKR
ncbi:MAG: hypothetical protein HXY46_08325 [Syntrophaceae bacterium]|nr:hypothetical protein [Syntrophaceae bacterium]